MKRLYHSTIKAKLLEILSKDVILPGQESIERADPYWEEEMEMGGVYTNFSSKYVYAWTNRKSADNCAKSMSRNAHPGVYPDDFRIPVIIPFLVDKFNVERDSDCKGDSGVRINGMIRNFEEPIFLKLQKAIYKAEKSGSGFWRISYND